MAQTPTIPEARTRPERDVPRRYLSDKDERDARVPSDAISWHGEKELPRISYHEGPTPRREQADHLESLIRLLAYSSTEKPRWQRIVEHANTLAAELGVSRERFYADALVEYIGKIENEKFTRELNASYEDVDQSEETEVLNYLVERYDPRFADE